MVNTGHNPQNAMLERLSVLLIGVSPIYLMDVVDKDKRYEVSNYKDMRLLRRKKSVVIPDLYTEMMGVTPQQQRALCSLLPTNNLDKLLA